LIKISSTSQTLKQDTLKQPNINPHLTATQSSAFRSICLNMLQWDQQARHLQQEQAAASRNFVVAAPAVPSIPSLSPALPPQRFATTPNGCTNLACLCPYMRVISTKNVYNHLTCRELPDPADDAASPTELNSSALYVVKSVP
jgi:hypothetical protein